MAKSNPDAVMNVYTTDNRSILDTAWRLATRLTIANEASMKQVPIPTLDATEVLVKVHCVAQNVRTQ
jgi:hypothetical protein